jgi:serine O-acetyltransferase
VKSAPSPDPRAPQDAEEARDARPVLDATIEALAGEGDDALAKAAAEGFPDPEGVIAWTDRVRHVLLHQRDRFALRSELSTLSDRLVALLDALPGGLPCRAAEAVRCFLEALPRVRAQLAEDVEAAYEGDPAATGYAEILVAYPSLQAVTIYRLAHELHELGVPLLPRIMTEHAHALYGIDIHPGAKIGRRFFIDHGTGVVIGGTAELGDRVKLYQGVTLGALSFPRDAAGRMIRGRKRHPTIEDDVTIYAGATILGGDTVIGRGSTIGGNVWLHESVPPFTRVQIKPPAQRVQTGEEDDAEAQLHWEI